MTENNTQAAEAASDLNAELDVVNNNMMCFWINNTEISHYLMAHINDQDNLTVEQKLACIDASFVIDELRDEVKKLRNKVFELDCKVKVCVVCKTAYENGTENAEIIEKMGVCENCITDI
jgi:hypothetical protein